MHPQKIYMKKKVKSKLLETYRVLYCRTNQQPLSHHNLCYTAPTKVFTRLRITFFNEIVKRKY